MDRITFLGTGGARVVMSTQTLSTGGFILEMNNTMLSIDPGPGAIVHAAQTSLDLGELDGVLLTHRHLDHCGDVNVIIEAMTRSGWKKRGSIFAPSDALEDDPVVLKYLRKYVKEVQVIEERHEYKCNGLSFETSMRHHHGNMETYGFVFCGSGYRVGYIPDTRYFSELEQCYSSDICIICTLLMNRRRVDHLSVPDVIQLVKEINPRTAILTHFGMSIINAGVEATADRIAQATGVNVIAAKDGMLLNLSDLYK